MSPDASSLAATEGSEFAAQVVKMPIGGGRPVRLGGEAGPAWSPDGQQLAFTSRRSGARRVWISGADDAWVMEDFDPGIP